MWNIIIIATSDPAAFDISLKIARVQESIYSPECLIVEIFRLILTGYTTIKYLIPAV